MADPGQHRSPKPRGWRWQLKAALWLFFTILFLLWHLAQGLASWEEGWILETGLASLLAGVHIADMGAKHLNYQSGEKVVREIRDTLKVSPFTISIVGTVVWFLMGGTPGDA